MTKPACIAVLIADNDARAVIETLLSRRYQSLGICRMSYEIVVASRHDPEVYKEAHELLRPYLNRAKCALVMLDYDGCGASVSCAQVEQDIETNLQRNGWSADCCAAVAIEPELEAWVWRDSVHIRRALGYGLEHSEKLTAILHRHGLQTNGKVSRPKEALIEALEGKPEQKT